MKRSILVLIAIIFLCGCQNKATDPFIGTWVFSGEDREDGLVIWADGAFGLFDDIAAVVRTDAPVSGKWERDNGQIELKVIKTESDKIPEGFIFVAILIDANTIDVDSGDSKARLSRRRP